MINDELMVIKLPFILKKYNPTYFRGMGLLMMDTVSSDDFNGF